MFVLKSTIEGAGLCLFLRPTPLFGVTRLTIPPDLAITVYSHTPTTADVNGMESTDYLLEFESGRGRTVGFNPDTIIVFRVRVCRHRVIIFMMTHTISISNHTRRCPSALDIIIPHDSHSDWCAGLYICIIIMIITGRSRGCPASRAFLPASEHTLSLPPYLPTPTPTHHANAAHGTHRVFRLAARPPRVGYADRG